MPPIYSARARKPGRRLYIGAAVAAASIRALFKANFARLLAEKNVNQTKMAEFVGVRPKVISLWKSGDAYPRTPDEIDKVIAFLGVDPLELYLDPHRLRLVNGGDQIEPAIVNALQQALESVGYKVEIKKPH